MAFDGITVAAIRHELDDKLTGGRIAKIIQPEPDELILTVKNNAVTYRLLLSASASLPLAYLMSDNKQAPMNAPNYCMLLRKHLAGGRIVSITQPGLERVLKIGVEHRDELGDMKQWQLVIELMGKHSNLILVNQENTIVDAIKRVPFHISSVREVLPGRDYFIPQTQNKLDPLTVSKEDFCSVIRSRDLPLFKAIYLSFTGLSPVFAEELCHISGLDSDMAANTIDDLSLTHLEHIFASRMREIQNGEFTPEIIYKEKEPFEFSAMEMAQFSALRKVSFDSMSALIETYYAEKELRTRIRQRSSDLRRVINTAIERNARTLHLQEKQMHDTEKREKYRIYGELLNTYGYSLEPGAKELEAINYYNNEPTKVPLDPMLTPSENAKKYFERYNKLKRTAEALEIRIKETEDEVTHLESIATALDIARDEKDLDEIRQEMSDYGYIKHKAGNGKKRSQASKPLHFVSSDGFDMYVGKNNYQNEEVSFKIASGNDWWFHANDLPGSHVIVKGNGQELPDRTFEEAGRLAAYFSKSKTSPKVEIDYTLRKNLRKPTGGRPGFVVYYTNYSLIAEPDITGIKEV